MDTNVKSLIGMLMLILLLPIVGLAAESDTAAPSCAHENAYISKTEENHRAYMSFDDIEHQYLVDVYERIVCPSCGLNEGTLLEAEVIRTADHVCDYDTGKCYICDYVNACKHPNAEQSQDEGSRTYGYTSISATEHQYLRDRYEHFFCPDCFMTKSEMIEEGIVKTGKHLFKAGACRQCEYVNTCKHTHVETQIRVENIRDYASISDRVHQYTCDIYEYYYCLDCRETTKGHVLEKEAVRTDRHWPDHETGKCGECGYVIECQHEHVIQSEGFQNIKSVKSISDHEHQYVCDVYEAFDCPDCGMCWHGERLERRVIRTEKHVVYDLGKCEFCDYVPACDHTRATITEETHFNVPEAYKCISDREHEYICVAYEKLDCPDCGMKPIRNPKEYVIRTEAHAFGNDGNASSCIYCGAKKAIVTPTPTATAMATPTPTPAPTATPTPDSAHTHIFDQETPANRYLAAEATCTTPSLYYKSCKCKEAGTETFENGQPKGHRFNGNRYACLEDGHARICTACSELDTVEPHKYNHKNACRICGTGAYQIIEGAGQIVPSDTKEPILFRSNAEIETFVEVQLNGSVLDPAHYTVREGSIIVKLKPEFVRTLPDGEYTLAIISDDNGTPAAAIAAFTVMDASRIATLPQTGDNSHPMLYIAMLMLSIVGILAAHKQKMHA